MAIVRKPDAVRFYDDGTMTMEWMSGKQGKVYSNRYLLVSYEKFFGTRYIIFYMMKAPLYSPPVMEEYKFRTLKKAIEFLGTRHSLCENHEDK